VATLGQELAIALRQVNALFSDAGDLSDGARARRSRLFFFGQKLKAALQDLWRDPAIDIFDIA
jgi:cohesin loading factor subunit SCC2